jgi:exodeoxyribonuclease V alpha subunit
LAFSISIHKSQGAEFPVVIIPVSMEQYRMLQRNIYYTGITRGRQLAVIIGEEKPLQIAVKTNRIDNRNTKLAYRLR